MTRHFSKMTDEELGRIVADAGLVAETLNTPGFRTLIEKRMIEAIDKAGKAARWRPGNPCVTETIALTRVYQDGRISGLEELAEIVNSFDADKAEALKILDARRKEREKKGK